MASLLALSNNNLEPSSNNISAPSSNNKASSFIGEGVVPCFSNNNSYTNKRYI